MLFDDMIADMEDHKKVSPFSYRIVYGRQKIEHFTCFCITTLFFKVLKDIRLKSTHYFVMKISNKINRIESIFLS